MTHPSPSAATSASPPSLGGRGTATTMGVRGCPPVAQDLLALEHTLWRADTRHDRALMDQTFAPDFHEFGRSGRRYTRDDLLPNGEAQTIDATLHALTVTDLSDTVALVTYISELRHLTGTDWANRSSLWHRATGRWRLRFHQGTPCEAPR